jgi:hypothetical protein
MKTKTVSGIRSPLPRLTRQRLERLRARIPLVALAAESGLSLSLLSEYERNLRPLNERQAAARSAALEHLSGVRLSK